MSPQTKPRQRKPRDPEMDRMIDSLLKRQRESGDGTPLDLLGELSKRLIERTLEAEMEEHLGYAKHDISGRNSGNSRNGTTSKTLQSTEGPIKIDVPRDREGEFEPMLIRKGQRKLGKVEDLILSLYAQGMTLESIQGHLLEAYEVEVSPALITRVTHRVHDEIVAWQSRPLESLYPVLFLDGIAVKTREDGVVRSRSAYLALGINLRGEKELLGIWMSENEGAKFWMSVISDLQNRGVEDVLVACVDGLKGFEEAIHAIYPEAEVQQCIVHQIRHSLGFVNWQDRKAVAADLRRIYTASTLAAAEAALDEFADKWDTLYPSISRSWRRNWNRLTVYFDYAPAIRKVIYTTNTIESLNSGIRKNLKTHKLFPDDRAAIKVIYLSVQRLARKWTRPITHWKPALNQLIIKFGERLERHLHD